MTLADRLALASPKEKRLLTLAALIIAVALPAQFLVFPLLERRAQAQDTLAEDRELLSWMQEQADQAHAIGATSGDRAASDLERLELAELERAILAAPFAPRLERLAPQSNDAAQITLADVSYTAVMTWLLQTGYDVRVRRADFRKNGPDRVDAALTIVLAP